MIKTKKCKLCDNPAFSKGLCKNHVQNSTIKSKTTNIKSKSKSIKSFRESTVERKKEKSELRSIYFDYHIDKCTHSEESGKPINDPTRSNICHIIDKGRHPSLQDNLDNYIYLTFNEHERFDYLLFSLRFQDLEKEFKNSWDLACTRSLKLLNLCHENTNFIRALKKYLDGRKET